MTLHFTFDAGFIYWSDSDSLYLYNLSRYILQDHTPSAETTSIYVRWDPSHIQIKIIKYYIYVDKAEPGKYCRLAITVMLLW